MVGRIKGHDFLNSICRQSDIIGASNFGAFDAVHGNLELVDDLHHAHKAGVHAQEIDLLAQDGSDRRENYLQFTIVQGIAVRGVVVADTAVFRGDVVVEEMPELLRQSGGPAFFFLLLPAAAMVPEDEGMPVDRVILSSPVDEIKENLGITCVGIAEVRDAVLLEPATFRDPEAPGQLVLDPVKLYQDIHVLRRTHLRHLCNVTECGAVAVIVPGHVDHDCTFCLYVSAVCCLCHGNLRF